MRRFLFTPDELTAVKKKLAVTEQKLLDSESQNKKLVTTNQELVTILAEKGRDSELRDLDPDYNQVLLYACACSP